MALEPADKVSCWWMAHPGRLISLCLLLSGPEGCFLEAWQPQQTPEPSPCPPASSFAEISADPHSQGRGRGEGGRTMSWRSQPELLCLSGFGVQEGAPWLFKGHSHVPWRGTQREG